MCVFLTVWKGNFLMSQTWLLINALCFLSPLGAPSTLNLKVHPKINHVNNVLIWLTLWSKSIYGGEFEPATSWSADKHFYHWATPAPKHSISLSLSSCQTVKRQMYHETGCAVFITPGVWLVFVACKTSRLLNDSQHIYSSSSVNVSLDRKSVV